MAETPRTPVAIRLVRPYDTEDEFLANELETVGKTSVILIGAHPRPTGVILRFEVTLAGGAAVLRGEGRVLAHKENAFRGHPGLALRFTRLDPKSKALVDRATAIREARANGDADPMSAMPASSARMPIAVASSPALPEEQPSSPSVDTARGLGPPLDHAPEKPSERWQAEAPTANGDVSAVAEALQETPRPPTPVRRRRTTRPPPSEEQLVIPESVREPAADTPPPPPPDEPAYAEASAQQAQHEDAPAPEPVHAPEPEPMREPTPAPAPVAAHAHTPSPTRILQAPPDKDALLSRLRERASSLSSERVAQILSHRT